MFKQLFGKAWSKSNSFASPASAGAFERLEGRLLMSAGLAMVPHGEGGCSGGAGGAGTGTILFSQAPSTVQTGLDALAAADNLTAPPATQTVRLANPNGIELYTVGIIASKGVDTKLTVDVNGKAFTPPTQSSTTFGGVTNTAVTAEIAAIATALNLTAPTASTTVMVSTAADGTATYMVNLIPVSSHSHGGRGGVLISVDANGDPVGNQRLPLSTLSAAIQNGLVSNAPAGATALTATSLVDVRTANGVTTYSATYKSTGIQTTVTVDAGGKLADLPSRTQVQFSTLLPAVQDELQTLATADGVAGTIDPTQTVWAYDEANGTTIYSVTLAVTTTNSKGKTVTHAITLSVDENGNPTVPPSNGPGENDRGGGGWAGGFGATWRRR